MRLFPTAFATLALVSMFTASIVTVENANAIADTERQKQEYLVEKLDSTFVEYQEVSDEAEEVLELCSEYAKDEERCERFEKHVEDSAVEREERDYGYHIQIVLANNTEMEAEVTEVRNTTYILSNRSDALIKEYNSVEDKKVNKASEKLKKTTEKAETVHEESEGRVDDKTSRKKLSKQIKVSEELLKVEVRDVSLDSLDKKGELREELKDAEDNLSKKTDKVVKEVKKRDERLAREAAARAAAARAAAARSQGGYTGSGGGYAGSGQTYSSGRGYSAPSPQGGGGYAGSNWSFSASNCADPMNGQGCVDSGGVTSIDYSASGGPQWIGGHSSGSAGAINNFKTGDTVSVNGSTYKITGSTYIPKKAGQSPSSLGTGTVFQTCAGDKMKVVYAEKQ